MRKNIIGFLLLLTFLAAPIFGQAPKKFIINPFTGQPDYYNDSTSGALASLTDVQFTLAATGDMIYLNAASKWVNLAIGIGGKYLRSTGTLPAWSSLLDADLPAALTGKSYNGVTPTAAATGFSLAGGTTSKSLTVELDSLVNQDLTTDSSPTLVGLTLGSAAANGTLNLYGLHANGYFNIIKGSNAEGLAGADLRIGLDESNRTLILCDRLDIGTDFGLTAASAPTLLIENAAANGNAKITSTGATGTGDFTITASGTAALVNSGSNQFKVGSTVSMSPAANIAAGNYFQSDYTVFGDNKNLTDTDGEQSWMYFNAAPNQSSTAAFNLIKGNAVLTGLGTGATGDGNNLLRLSVSGVTANRIDVYGHMHGGESASLGDTVALVTHIADTWVGQITVTTSDGYCAIYRLDGTALTAVSANAIFTTTKGTDVKWNVYIETNVVKVENQIGTTQTAKALFIGY